MTPPRRIQHRREHPRGTRRSLEASDAFGTPNNGQNRPSSASRSGSSGTATSGTSGLTGDPPTPPSPSNYFNYAPYSEEDPNLDADEATGDSDVEGEESELHAEGVQERTAHDVEQFSDLLKK